MIPNSEHVVVRFSVSYLKTWRKKFTNKSVDAATRGVSNGNNEKRKSCDARNSEKERVIQKIYDKKIMMNKTERET